MMPRHVKRVNLETLRADVRKELKDRHIDVRSALDFLDKAENNKVRKFVIKLMESRK